MGYSLGCPCGRVFEVQAGQAGSKLHCPCGAEVQVPSVSKLRELAGKAAYEVGTIDVIQGMLKRGELPAGKVCAVSGKATADVIELRVEAERLVAGAEDGKLAIVSLFMPILVLFRPSLLLNSASRPEFVGRETAVRTPLIVDSAHQARFRRSSQKRMKRWLRTVPIYATLMDEYPRAIVKCEANH